MAKENKTENISTFKAIKETCVKALESGWLLIRIGASLIVYGVTVGALYAIWGLSVAIDAAKDAVFWIGRGIKSLFSKKDKDIVEETIETQMMDDMMSRTPSDVASH